jgi:DUF1365 family protein
LTYLFLDLAELPGLIAQLPLFSDRRFGWASIYRPDHLGDRRLSLEDAVRAKVQQVTNRDFLGSIRLLTLWRSLGYYFSPINLYFCYSKESSSLVEFIVAEVNNTPWREQHCYVLWSENQTASQRLAFCHAKEFHVSPFFEMDLEYDWRIIPPAERLVVQLETRRGSERVFDATLSLHRRELNQRNWLATTVSQPLIPARVLVAIYYEAFWLWMRKCPFFPHPPTQAAPSSKAANDPPRSLRR